MSDSIYVTSPAMPPFEEYIDEIADMWETRHLTHTGPKHQALEAQLCEYLRVDNISLFANGHLALEIALDALELNGEIITTPFTFASTSQAIINKGLTTVFCDINEKNYTIDADLIESLITKNTCAILPVHVYGNICDVEKIANIARKYNLKVIYDAAHAFGITLNDIGIGSFGDISMFSFHATKVFHTVEGGALTYGDGSLTATFKQIRQFGMIGEDVLRTGTNAKMTDMHAAMGLCNLRHIDEYIAKRREIVVLYRKLLSDIEGLTFCEEQLGVKSNYAYFPIEVNADKFGITRDQLHSRLIDKNIYSRKYFYPLVSQFPVYSRKYSLDDTPVAARVARNILTLPLYPDLSLDNVHHICNVIIEAKQG